ncbi:MAG: phenylalanine--tRNA ligase subunit alpha [Oscillospiraceae bacterium]|nr:phenylalanine--tRNA ligase subunit alpha [Oscillospiraceae bacterium]
MQQQLENIENAAMTDASSSDSIKALDELRIKYLGKKGELTAILKQMGKLSAEERPVIGQLANKVRQDIEEAITSKMSALKSKEKERKMAAESIDITLPGKQQSIGKLHPLKIVENEIKEIFLGMGFSVADGPEVEFDYYNFEALNLPPDHPARDTQDTFYITDNILLRTQTSSVQVHVMENQKPPIRIISPGCVYRSDAVDATHSPLFHQIEGLVVDKGITMSDLKGTLETLMKKLYGNDCKIRLRPHHFPFTEPSAEVDVMCFNCHGEGCRICKGEGYIELLGAGMVHPKVLEGCGIDSSVYSGFAFGMGLERIVMRRFNISDMRLLFENDLRFLEQF